MYNISHCHHERAMSCRHIHCVSTPPSPSPPNPPYNVSTDGVARMPHCEGGGGGPKLFPPLIYYILPDGEFELPKLKRTFITQRTQQTQPKRTKQTLGTEPPDWNLPTRGRTTDENDQGQEGNPTNATHAGNRTSAKKMNGLRCTHRPFVYLEPKWLR